MKPTLLVLAAGMGSRYGGLKQLDPVGPNGEPIMDYSIFDAIRAGFGKIVFVIRRDIEEEFKKVIGTRYAGHVEVEYAFQRLDDLPDDYTVPPERTKPWGTGQAVYAARNVIHTPFAVINADDFYGADAYKKMAAYLSQAQDREGKGDFAMCAFILANTLSENGSVSRGICEKDAADNLIKVVEHTKILREGNAIHSYLEDGSIATFTGEELVSMNMWGFTPSLFPRLEKLFCEFLAARGKELKSEFYIPFVADSMIHSGEATVKVLTSTSSWFGITYREDKPQVVASIRNLVDSGAYPETLFN